MKCKIVFVALIMVPMAIPTNVVNGDFSDSKDEKLENYTIQKILDSFENKEWFTKEYINDMFENMAVSDETKIIADSYGGLIYSVCDDHLVSKTYEADGALIESLSLDSSKATTVGELKKALYGSLGE